ncbi:L7Ae/L30e/S12e/Gadd45 family ribosomal protein [Anaerovorax odorimutans]|uniref:L7Ae/L30e/S12e/Gadd45 family ribosomal protein n=1 Tax=Anaerovorax odorimutans TaxID=109327 RepID=UPI000403B5C9|nr:ribosomal L7Ae/L30e/S12e/Gadd45 family protein [Anaerovorax odorimutans]
MRKKIDSYLGFAKKSGNLVTGYNTCIFAINKRKVKLLILTQDLSNNTIKKMINLAKNKNVIYRIYGKSQELSNITGSNERGIFGITDTKFAEVILKEIDKE